MDTRFLDRHFDRAGTDRGKPARNRLISSAISETVFPSDTLDFRDGDAYKLVLLFSFHHQNPPTLLKAHLAISTYPGGEENSRAISEEFLHTSERNFKSIRICCLMAKGDYEAMIKRLRDLVNCFPATTPSVTAFLTPTRKMPTRQKKKKPRQGTRPRGQKHSKISHLLAFPVSNVEFFPFQSTKTTRNNGPIPLKLWQHSR